MIWTPGLGNEYQFDFYRDMGYIVSFGSKEIYMFKRLKRVREQYLGLDHVSRVHLMEFGTKINEIISYLEDLANRFGELEDGD